MKTSLKILVWLLATTWISGCATKIPIIAVQLMDDDGTNRAPITPNEIHQWVDYTNKTWGKKGYKFTFNEKKDFVQVYSTVLNSQPPDNDDPAWEFYRINGNFIAMLLPSNRLPVFFRQRGGAGWSWGPGNTNFISMPSYTNTCISKPTPGKPCPGGCCPNNTLLSHELGHFYGLAHTFTGVACSSVTLNNTDGDVNGQLASTKDDVHDTPPDPGAICALTTSLKCPGGKIVVNGTSFKPPWTNFMSYHDCLPERISADQASVIKLTRKDPWRKRLEH
jgi:hypothetical protein